ncbi:MAG: bifunctional DNA primase/polymerase [Actinomycetota bacterium]|nr:bifunctional DNA primase/polymerase [Actinomycetota bacterium]
MSHTFTTCIACGGEVDVHTTGQRTHPTCTPPFNHEDDLTAQYVAAVEAENMPLADQLEHALDMLDAAPPRLGDAALAYVSWGWPVFPLGAKGKIPLPKCGECRETDCDGPEVCGHELCHGFKDATTNPDTVRRWWADRPHCNIGLATGHRFDVLDVDPKGIWSWVDLRDSAGRPDIHGIAGTPRSGLHVYLTASGGGNLAGFRPGLDYRGVGGYVVAPPSIRADGHRYRWRVHPSPTLTSSGFAVEQAA